MRLGFRTRTFLAVFAVAAAAVLLGETLLALTMSRDVNRLIERSLVAETHMAAELLAGSAIVDDAGMDLEADRIGERIGARVTLVDATGRVIGDSAVPADGLSELENHADRPEVLAARQQGLGVSRRYSHTLAREMLYVAAPTAHARVSVVRLALPLTDVAEQLGRVWHATGVALAVALVSAFGLAWLSSHLLGRRINAIAESARAYARGDLSRPSRDYEADELGTVARVLDDSVRQLAARMSEISEDRARLEAILTGMQEGVVVLDAAGRIQMMNRAARSMLSLHDDATGRRYVESFRHPGIVDALTQALEGGHPAPIEFQPARSALTLVARAAPVVAPSARGAVLVLHDVSDLRRSDRVRRDFVANVSHELRTPLTAIRGYVEALAEEPLEPDERAQFLSVIARQTTRLERLVQDLLRLASLDAREEPIEAEVCSLAELFGLVVRDLSPSLEHRGQHVQVAVAPEASAIYTDAAKLQDALRNILENASSYSPPGSRIDLTAAREGERVIIRVADEGPGIPEADLERIFERFYRVDKARSRESGGTGLGLSIVKHLVARLSGEVRAANRPEGGAVFTLALPARPVQGR